MNAAPPPAAPVAPTTILPHPTATEDPNWSKLLASPVRIPTWVPSKS